MVRRVERQEDFNRYVVWFGLPGWQPNVAVVLHNDGGARGWYVCTEYGTADPEEARRERDIYDQAITIGGAWEGDGTLPEEG